MSNPIPIALLIHQVLLEGNEPTIGREAASTYPVSQSTNPVSQSDSSNPSLQLNLSHRPTLTLARKRPSSVQSTSRPQTGSHGGSSPTPQR